MMRVGTATICSPPGQHRVLINVDYFKIARIFQVFMANLFEVQDRFYRSRRNSGHIEFQDIFCPGILLFNLLPFFRDTAGFFLFHWLFNY